MFLQTNMEKVHHKSTMKEANRICPLYFMSFEATWKLCVKNRMKFISYMDSFGSNETREKECEWARERESFGKDEWIGADFLTAGDSTF